jgi:hypothetical protein
MHEGSLGIHEVELVIDSGENFSDCSRVGDHANGSYDLSEVTTWNHSWWLVVDSTLKATWCPIDKLDCSLRLNGSNCGINIFWNDVTSVHHATSHVFPMSWITLSHH